MYMEIVSRGSILWMYLESDIKGLITDGEKLLDLVREEDKEVSDFSYLVFPFSKAYEGFLKKLFMDMGVIDEKDYYGDDVRIGRILSPNYRKENAGFFNKICLKNSGKGEDLADKLWASWHKGRNRVFHYFPHNFRRLTYLEALDIIRELAGMMGEAVLECRVE